MRNAWWSDMGTWFRVQLYRIRRSWSAVSYALGQGAPLIAAIWGVFIWKEFKGSTKSVNQLLALMFIFFLVGLGMIVVAGN